MSLAVLDGLPQTPGPFRHFAWTVAAAVLLPACLVAAFVIGIDPYYVFGAPDWRGINEVRPYYEPHVIVAKPYQVRPIAPDAVALGSSRVEVGIDPRHPAWKGARTFNFAMPSSTIYEEMLALNHALAVNPNLKTAVLGLDFFGFNIFFTRTQEQKESRFAGDGVEAFADFLTLELSSRQKEGTPAPTPPEAGQPTFDGRVYLAVNPDVQDLINSGRYTSAQDHYDRAGRLEGRKGGEIPPAWEEKLYLALNPDVAAAVGRGEFISGWHHFVVAGESEQRPSGFVPKGWNESAYLQANPIVRYAISIGNFVSGYHHYVSAGKAEGYRGGFLPADWHETNYLAQNPSARIRLALGDYPDSYSHYAGVGASQGLLGGQALNDGLQHLQTLWPALQRFLFQVREIMTMVFSKTALRDAISTLSGQNKSPSFDGRGMRVWKGQADLLLAAGGTGSVFRTSLLAGKWDLWLDAPRRMYCFTNQTSGMTMFDPYRFLLRRAYSSGLDLRLYTTPLHAAVRQLLIDLGLGERYDFWLDALARINEEEASRFSRSPFPLWDFSTPSTVTMEPIPPMGAADPMKYYWEFSHYRSETGNLIMDRIFGLHDQARHLPDDFGVKITTANVRTHIDKSRHALGDWDDSGDLKASISYLAKVPGALNNQKQATCW